MNIQRLGDSFLADLTRKQEESSYMVDLALQVGEYVISNNGRLVWEWPTYCQGWRLPNLVGFIARHRLMMVQFHGCMLGLKGKQNKWLKKPWTLATNDRRVVELFAEMQCNHNSNQHEPCEGGNAARTAYYTVPKRFTPNSFTRNASQQCQSRQPIYKTTSLILKTPLC